MGTTELASSFSLSLISISVILTLDVVISLHTRFLTLSLAPAFHVALVQIPAPMPYSLVPTLFHCLVHVHEEGMNLIDSA